MNPHGEIIRHKGLKSLAYLGAPARVWPRAPKASIKNFIIKNKILFRGFAGVRHVDYIGVKNETY